MEHWADFDYYPPIEETLYGIFSPPSPPLEMPKSAEWSSEENKAFETALAELDSSSPTFFEDIASKVPWRSVDEIKIHYQALIRDIEMIENGTFPIPDYPDPVVEVQEKSEPRQGRETAKKEETKTRNGQPRRRGVPWTEEEHQLFLMGLNKYGKGDWRSISRYYVISKTPTQVASHAQKYFRRQTSATPPDRRRPSIHDIHTVTPAAAAFVSHLAPPHHNPLPNYSTNCALIPNSAPLLHHGGGGFGAGGSGIFQNNNNNAGFLPPFDRNCIAAFQAQTNVQPYHVHVQPNDYNHHLFNQMPSTSAAAQPSTSSSPYFPPFPHNQYWG